MNQQVDQTLSVKGSFNAYCRELNLSPKKSYKLSLKLTPRAIAEEVDELKSFSLEALSQSIEAIRLEKKEEYATYLQQELESLNDIKSQRLGFDVPIKLLLVGDCGVGKTKFLASYVGGEPAQLNESLRVYPLIIPTNKGPIKFNVWVLPGPDKFGEWYGEAHAAIIMFDFASRITWKNVPNWSCGLTRICGDIPIALVGNNAGIKGQKFKATQMRFHRKKNLQHYEIPCKADASLIVRPFLGLAKMLPGAAQLDLAQDLALQPPESNIDDVTEKRFGAEVAAVRGIPLPEDDDDDEFY